jgi:non-specific riboncleoside hydrolase
MVRRKIIIDTDPGIDDAVALALALFDETLDVSLITTVAGNVSVTHTTNNTLQLLAFYEQKVAVAKGASSPLMRAGRDASDVHGESGMGCYEFPPADETLLLAEPAASAIARVVADNERITLVAIGPLTNIALFIRTYPELCAKVEALILMGGSTGRGNYGVYSEFNIGYDPEAAHIVFTSGIPLTMVGLDVGSKALVYPAESEQIKSMHAIGEMFYDLFKTYRGGSFHTGLKMYDACAIAYLLRPDLFETITCNVRIETNGHYTAGATVVDLQHKTDLKDNATVAIDIDANGFKTWFMQAMAACEQGKTIEGEAYEQK